MGDYHYEDECPTCRRAFVFVKSGGPCATCQHCCDCCTCHTVDFHQMHEEVRSLYGCDLVDLFAAEDSFSMTFKTDLGCTPNMDLFDKNMVKIAIWPYSMEDDEIVFDPETGRLTDEVAEKVEHYLRLNMAMIPPDEEMPDWR